MSTRSQIAITLPNGRFRAIYAHWDGYPQHNGLILYRHYSDETKLNALLDHGDVSILAPEIGERHPFDARCDYEGWCTFYGRDRNEPNIQAREFATFADLVEHTAESWGEYLYVFDKGVWLYAPIPWQNHKAAELRPLADDLWQQLTDEEKLAETGEPVPC